MNQWQKTFYEKFSQKRDKILKPILFILTKLKVSPNAVTLAGILSMLSFTFYLKNNAKLALIFIFFSVFFDSLDGALARYQSKNTDKGKFIDVSADCLNFFIFLLGLILANISNTFTFMPLAFFMLLSRTLRIYLNHFDYQSDWLFHPVAGFLPNLVSFTIYLLAILEIYLNYAILTSQLMFLFAIILIVDSIISFNKILQKK